MAGEAGAGTVWGASAVGAPVLMVEISLVMVRFLQLRVREHFSRLSDLIKIVFLCIGARSLYLRMIFCNIQRADA
jgi:hypothetical protein